MITLTLSQEECDPAAVDACGVQYPLAVKSCDSSMHCAFESLCWVAYVGYVNPARTNELDRLLQQYRGAGFVISSCPGPAPHDTRCVQNTAGAFTCGGF